MAKLMGWEKQKLKEKILDIGSPEWRKVCNRLNELDSKGWTNLSKEETNEHTELTKQLPD